jgi:hypothetical protein
VYALDTGGNYSKTNTVTFSIPSYQGIYTGTFASTTNPSDKGLVGVIILSDGDGLFIGGNKTPADNTSSFAFEFMTPLSGEFSIPTGDGLVTGKLTATGITGTFTSTNEDNGTIKIERGSFTLTKQSDTGAQAANAGIYMGTFTTNGGDHSTGVLRALLSANGQVLFTFIVDGTDDVGGASTGSVSAGNVFTGLIDGVTKTLGNLNPSDKTISGSFNDSDNIPTSIELHRVYAPSDVMGLGLVAPNGGTAPSTDIAGSATTQFAHMAAERVMTRIPNVPMMPLPESTPAVLGAAAVNSNFVVTFATEPGKAYTLQATDDFVHWSDVATVTADSTQAGFTAAIEQNQASRFYRVVSQ